MKSLVINRTGVNAGTLTHHICPVCIQQISNHFCFCANTEGQFKGSKQEEMLLLISVGVTGSRQIASLVCVRGEGSTLRILQPKSIRKPNLHPAPPLGQLSGLHYSRPCDYTVLHMPKSSGYQTPHRAVLTSYFSPHRTDCSFSSPLYSAIPKVRAV